jgi:putative flippase GtrA
MSAIGMSEHSGLKALIGQLWRYGVSGGLTTALNVGIYWVMAVPLGVAPLIANLLGYVAAVSSGYVLHSRWSFRGHGRRDDPVRTTSRFFITSLISLGLNSLWVWLLTGYFQLDPSWPTLPMLFVTPLIIFALYRRWVFA